jgi:glycosyltransferase involved in cell wall biosynthesis
VSEAAMPKVSVVIPAYNYARFLADALRSVLGQTYKDIEVIIVDDGSKDNTGEVAKAFSGDPRVRYVYQDNSGVSAARNNGIRSSRGEYVAFLDADDYWLPGNLEAKVKILDSRQEVALVCSDINIFDHATGRVLSRFWHNPGSDDAVDQDKASKAAALCLIDKGCFIQPSAVLLRKSVLSETGDFDVSLKTHEDWDLFVRIVRRFPVAVIDKPLAMVRKHGNSLQSDSEAMSRDAVTVLYKALSEGSLSDQELRLIRRRIARSHALYGWFLILHDRSSMGRKEVVVSIKRNPWSFKPYVYLCLSFLGKSVVSTLVNVKRKRGAKTA